MMFHWVNESYGLAGLYLMLSLFGVCLYAILAGGSYLVFFVLRREKHHPGTVPTRTNCADRCCGRSIQFPETRSSCCRSRY